MNQQQQVGSAGCLMGKAAYQTSQPGDTWGQPPASQYIFYVDNMILHGQLQGSLYYVEPTPTQLSIDPDLLAEFAAWDAASDEAIEGM